MQNCVEPSVTQKYRGQNLASDIFVWRLLVFGAACIFTFSSLLPVGSVYGQVEEPILVQAPDTSAFPQITLQVTLPDSIEIGNDLQGDQFEILEDGREVSVRSLQRERRGVHFTLAINGGRDLDLRDAAGVSNFDKLRDVLRDWAFRREDYPEDAWSLTVNDGANLINVSESEDWIGGLMAYTPDFRAMPPDLTSLSTAIQFAETRVVPFGVDKAVLYLTPPPAVDQIDEIYALTEKARTAGIQVNVWMLGDPLFLNNDQGEALISLAEVSGGTFFHYSGVETLPDPGTFLSNLGTIYRLQYESLIRKPGMYSLEISANHEGETYRGEWPSFYLDVQPPKPILVDPPSSVIRDQIAATGVNSGKFVDAELTGAFYPDFQPVKITVQFPDGYPREITVSRLLVNGAVVAVNDSPPFDVLNWDLVDFTQSGEQLIQVEITDSLGLSGLTNEYPIQLVVNSPEPAAEKTVLQMVLFYGGILLGLVIVTLLVWLAIRLIRIANLNHLKRMMAKRKKMSAGSRGQPGTQPEKVYATLVPTGQLKQDWEKDAIRITKPDGIFGTRSGQADYLLHEDGVNGIRARLTFRDGGIWLNDLESTLGTWVNYRRIGTEPVNIHPGDLIHLGNCGFRFTMISSSLPDAVRLTPYEPIL